MGFYNNLCPGCMNEIGDAENCPYCGFDTKSEQTPPFLAYGTVLAGKYVIGDILEKNSEGVTYLGLDSITNNCVRIREFLPEGYVSREKDETRVSVSENNYDDYKSFRKDFLDMWHKIMKLRTLDSIITVLDVFEANDTAYAIAEADGSITLSEFISENENVLDWNTVTKKLFPVLDSIEALHDTGVIHGAISPDTLFLCANGNFKLWGFGIKETRQAEGKIAADIRPGYAAIEQYSKDTEINEATDVYGFISVLYNCVTGTAPIDATVRKIADTLTIPADYARNLPDYVLAAFIGALQVETKDRTGNVKLLKISFTKEAFEKQKAKAAAPAPALKPVSLIDPISDIDQKAQIVTVRSKATPVILTENKPIPVIKPIQDDAQPATKNSSASMIIMSISIVLVMLIFFGCLAITGVISFNGGSSTGVVEMPNFENYRKDDAYITQIAEKYGLHITLQPASSAEIAKDVIFEQNVAAGTKIARGSEVTLTYSKGATTVTLPNFTGVTFTETVYYLGKLNLSYNIVEKENNGTQKAGYVAAMTPGAGSVVFEGTEITIEIWGEPKNGQTVTGPNTGSEITNSTSILDSIFGSLSDSVSGLGSTIQSFFG